MLDVLINFIKLLALPFNLGEVSSSSSSQSNSSSSQSSSSSSQFSSSSSQSSSAGAYYEIENGGTFTVVRDVDLSFVSVTGNTATIIIDGVSFVVKNEDGLFVWDNNSVIRRKVFTVVGEKIIIRVNNSYIRITYDGIGSLLFSVEFTNFYESIADLISSAQDRGADISFALCRMRRDLENSEIISTNTDKTWLFKGVDETYKSADAKHNNYSAVILNFVFRLQTHIIDEYGSVNDYLSDNSIQVPETFADISDTVGFTIDAGNIA